MSLHGGRPPASSVPPGPMPRLVMEVQPNKNQKRRYNSDGPTRGQIKDDSGERVPAVRLENYHHHALIYMMACTSNGEPHPFFELQSVDKCGCKASMLDGRPAVITETSPDKSMEARFAACLKRLAMRAVQEQNEFDFTKWKCESEKVHLGFLAVALPSHSPLASCLSTPIHMVQGRLLELKRIIPGTGSCDGETTICITGKNFPSSSNLKVRFFLAATEGSDISWESYGDVDNNDSSEKHLVVTVPRGPNICRERGTVQVAVEILPGTATQTRQKGKHLYYSYISPTSGSHSQIASSIDNMRSQLVKARETTTAALVNFETRNQATDIQTLLPKDNTYPQPYRLPTGGAAGGPPARYPFTTEQQQVVCPPSYVATGGTDIWTTMRPHLVENPVTTFMNPEVKVEKRPRHDEDWRPSKVVRAPVPVYRNQMGIHNGAAPQGMTNGTMTSLTHQSLNPGMQTATLNPHDADAMDLGMFSPNDHFSTAGQPSPCQMQGMAGLDTYAASNLSPMVPLEDIPMTTTGGGDLLLALSSNDDTFERLMNSADLAASTSGQ